MAGIEIRQEEKNLLIISVAMVAVFMGVVWGANKVVNDYFNTKLTANAALKKQNSEYINLLSKIVDEERQQLLFVEKYLSYDDAGLIKTPETAGGETVDVSDEEQRLAWLSKLQDIRSDRSFFKIDYELFPPEIVDPDFSEYTQGSSVKVRSNRMKVSFPMLHALDMLMLINDFYDEEDNRFVSTSCSFRRINFSFQLALRENIRGSCDLVWLTVFDDKKIQTTEGTSGKTS